ncbi:hypothetical protein Tco_1294858 [Tanacetum coccineum]
MHEKFFSQDKYVAEILKKFRFTEVKTTSTPMETQKPLLKDEDGEEVDVHMYSSTIGSLMYLTYSRPDIMFAMCACARYQVNQKVSHPHVVKRIFRALEISKGKNSYLPSRWQEHNHSESSVRRDLQLADEEGIDCLPNSTIFEQLTLMGPKTTAWNEFSSTMASVIICLATNQKFNFSKLIFDSMIRNLDSKQAKFLMYPSLVRAATIASSLEAEQDSGNINKTQSKETPNESSFLGTTSGGGPRCQETMGDTIAQTRFENVSKHSNDSLLTRGNRLQSEEDRLKLDELMPLCTTLQNRILDLKKTKTSQHNEIASLKKRVKKLEKKDRSRTYRLKRLYKVGLTARLESSDDEESLGDDASKQGRIDAIDLDEEINLVSAVGDIVSAATLEEIKSTKPKKKGIVIQELGESTTTISSQQLQDKESTKKQKVEDDKETAELKQRMEIIPDEEEVAIDDIPLAVKSPNLYYGREEVSSYTIYTYNIEKACNDS